MVLYSRCQSENRMNTKATLCKLLCVSFCLTFTCPAMLVAVQDESSRKDSIQCQLKLRRDMPPAMSYSLNWIDPETGARSDGAMPVGKSFEAKQGGHVFAKATLLDREGPSCRLVFDSDGDGSFENESEFVLRQNEKKKVVIRYRVEETVGPELPYQVSFVQFEGEEKVLSYVNWAPLYVAEGQLELGGESATLCVRDFDGDGRFDDDFGGGTTISIDRNHDGKYFGKNEWVDGTTFFEFAGKKLTLDRMSADGSMIQFKPWTIPIPVLGEVFPSHKLTLADGKTVDLSNPGQPVLIDLWAIWCGVCVKKIPAVKELSQESGVSAVFLNVDSPDRLEEAREKAIELEIDAANAAWPVDDEHYLFKMAGSIDGCSNSVPILLLIDSDGVLRYAGSGSDDFAGLKNSLSELANQLP